jgi:hypothetical protein
VPRTSRTHAPTHAVAASCAAPAPGQAFCLAAAMLLSGVGLLANCLLLPPVFRPSQVPCLLPRLLPRTAGIRVASGGSESPAYTPML